MERFLLNAVYRNILKINGKIFPQHKGRDIMSVLSVNNPLANGYGLDIQSIRKRLEEEQNSENLQLNNETYRRSQTASLFESDDRQKEENIFDETQNSLSYTDLASLTAEIAENLGITGKVTYNDMIAYRDKLSEDFQETVKAGLAELGVDEDADFRLSMNSDGTIQVSSNHKDKAKIEQYFKENPELAEDYEKIQVLNQVENARKNSGMNLSDAYEKAKLLSYSSGMVNNMALAMTGSGSLASILSGFNRTV